MARVFLTLVMSTCVVASILAQSFEQPRELLDYRFLTPSSAAIHKGLLYTSYIEVAGVYVFDSTLSSMIGPVTHFSGDRNVKLFHASQQLVGCTMQGRVYYFDNKADQWRRIGEFEVYSRQGDSSIIAVAKSKVFELQFTGAKWDSTIVGSIATDSNVRSVVRVADTLVYTLQGSSQITIATLSGQVVRRIEIGVPHLQLFKLGDGSIAIEDQLSTHLVLSVGKLQAGNVGYMRMDTANMKIDNAEYFSDNGHSGIIGCFSVMGNDEREGVYTMTSETGIERRNRLDSLFQGVLKAVIDNGDTILCTYGKIVVAKPDGRIVKTPWLIDTISAFSPGVSFTQNGTPFLTGMVTANGEKVPSLFPTSRADPITVLPELKNAYLVTRYVHINDGPEVAFCSKTVYTRTEGENWKSVATSAAGFTADRIDVLNDSIIVCRSIPRFLLTSTDKGQTWKKTAIGGYLWAMLPTIASSNVLWGIAQDTVMAIDLHAAADSILPPRIGIRTVPLRLLFACSDQEVSLVTGRSIVDTTLAPASLTHLACFKWTPDQARLDSAVHELRSAINANSVIAFARSDTAYLWDFTQRRLIAVTYNGIVYDTSFADSAFGAYSEVPLTRLGMDNNGIPWLFTTSETCGFKLDPSTSVATSISNYYEHLYVGLMHPNPASDNLRVTLGRFPTALEDNMQLYLVNLSGSIVRDFTAQLHAFPGPSSKQEVLLSVSGLPTGMYLLVFENSQGASVGKIMVSP